MPSMMQFFRCIFLVFTGVAVIWQLTAAAYATAVSGNDFFSQQQASDQPQSIRPLFTKKINVNNIRWQNAHVAVSAIDQSNAKVAATFSQQDNSTETGQLEAHDLLLTYMQQRYDERVVGRFYSNDPVGFKTSNPMMFNRYAYANNNPYKYIDPDGRDPDRLSGMVAGAVLSPENAATLVRITAAAGDSSYSAGVSAGIQLVEGANELASGASVSQVASNTVNRANASGSDGITKDVLTRKSVGRDGAKSQQSIERDSSGNVISRTHTVTKDGEVLHQHQNHIGKEGGVRQFPDEWTGTTTINAPYENTPPTFPADKVPGGKRE